MADTRAGRAVGNISRFYFPPSQYIYTCAILLLSLLLQLPIRRLRDGDVGTALHFAAVDVLFSVRRRSRRRRQRRRRRRPENLRTTVITVQPGELPLVPPRRSPHATLRRRTTTRPLLRGGGGNR